ncbi:hypothetical protein OSTOST_12547 [Ostertagia ostertagi]
MVINTAAIAMILSLAFLVNKKGKEMRSSRHQGSCGEESDSVSVSSRNRMIRVLTIVVGVFVCSSYLCVVSVHIALQMGLEEDYHDYIMTFNVHLDGVGTADVHPKLLRVMVSFSTVSTCLLSTAHLVTTLFMLQYQNTRNLSKPFE